MKEINNLIKELRSKLNWAEQDAKNKEEYCKSNVIKLCEQQGMSVKDYGTVGHIEISINGKTLEVFDNNEAAYYYLLGFRRAKNMEKEA